MGVLKTVAKTIKVVQVAAGTDMTAAAAWAAATDLGELNGKPYVKLTWEPETYESQKGMGQLAIKAKFETSTLELQDATVLTAVKAMRDKNVCLQVTPFGVVSATNPILLILDFKLLLGGEFNAGAPSFLKLSGEKPASDEAEFFAHDAAAA